MTKLPFKLTAPPSGWLDRFPDGDYTVGRGADPRGSTDRSVDAKRQKAPRKPAKKRKRTAEAAK